METVGENFDLMELEIPNPDDVQLVTLRKYMTPYIQDNVNLFESVFRPLYDKGRLLYHREIRSSMGPRVTVWDHVENRERRMLMFGSNNYLGLADDPEIKAEVIKTVETLGVGMAGPMILNGTGLLHKQLETELAAFKRKEAALVVPTG